jgi:hypothetical protein
VELAVGTGGRVYRHGVYPGASTGLSGRVVIGCGAAERQLLHAVVHKFGEAARTERTRGPALYRLQQPCRTLQQHSTAALPHSTAALYSSPAALYSSTLQQRCRPLQQHSTAARYSSTLQQRCRPCGEQYSTALDAHRPWRRRLDPAAVE